MDGNVPPFKWDQGEMSPDQKDFLRQWWKAWKMGKALHIGDQYSYVFEYMKYCIRHENPHKIIEELTALRQAYPEINRNSKSFHSHLLLYIADSYVILRKINTAISTLSAAYRLLVPVWKEKLLSLRAFIGEDVKGMDILFWRGAPRVTSWGRENLTLIAEYIESDLMERLPRSPEQRIVDRWIQHTEKVWANDSYRPSPWYEAYNGRARVKIPYYSFRVPEDDYAIMVEIWRDAENLARESKGVANVGEGWISETELYYEIKQALPNHRVIQHASPVWLGRQHLDIFIPSLSVAVEYQGRQHYEPIEHFGGEEAFMETQRRDTRKLALCKKHGVTLIYVRKGYVLDEVISEIWKEARGKV